MSETTFKQLGNFDVYKLRHMYREAKYAYRHKTSKELEDKAKKQKKIITYRRELERLKFRYDALTEVLMRDNNRLVVGVEAVKFVETILKEYDERYGDFP